ncbi:MAG: twin-arginine translocase TatA/TatE family subunit [Thermoprotei archaeon]|jgi:sec-independent protein translocase protein TatA
MALDPLETLVAGIIILALIIWGPSKIPELARALGRAKREYEKASRGLEEEINKIAQLSSTESSQTVSSASGDDKLIEIAKNLGINTEGKTRDEIAKEIIEKAKGTNHSQS